MRRYVVSFVLLIFFANAVCAQSKQAAINPPSDLPKDARVLTLMLLGNPAGYAAMWKSPDGLVHTKFEFNDRGRGPKLEGTYRLDAKGMLISAKVAGNDYIKSPVDEQFMVANGGAEWKSSVENGRKPIGGPAFYVELNGSPFEYEMLAQALLANGGSLALLPEGEAHLEKLGTKTISVAGKTINVTQYALTGLDFSPTRFWLDDQQHLFGSATSWFTFLQSGWEPAAKELADAQENSEKERALELAHKLAHHPANSRAVFRNANLFDAATGKVRNGVDVTIEGNRISSVQPSVRQRVADAEVIDATGKTLLPGLWDMHAHVSGDDGFLNLAAGVTTVRDLANDNDALRARIDRVNRGDEIGTRVIAAGFIDGPGPFQGPTKVLADNQAEARKYVQMYAGWGYPQIKMYSSVKPELVPVIINEAHKHGMRVSGHIPSGLIAEQCVKMGFDEIQHVNFLMLNFMPDVKETRTPARFTEVAKRGAALDLNSAPVQHFIKLLKARNVSLDPTLTAFEGMFTQKKGEVDPAYAMIASRLPAQIRRGLLSGAMPTSSPQETETYAKSYQKMIDLIGIMYRAGIPIESGTDTIAGFGLEREFELHVKAGIPAAKVLSDATLGAARIMRRDKDLGSIEPGKLADMVLVDGDPTKDISTIRKTVVTMKDGIIYRPEELYRELGVAP